MISCTKNGSFIDCQPSGLASKEKKAKKTCFQIKHLFLSPRAQVKFKKDESFYMTSKPSVVVALAIGMSIAANATAVTFDDFNVDEGHFNLAPNFSATTVGEDASSSADRVTTSPFEGLGAQKLTLVHDATTTPYRIRHLSGGGTVANNISFNTTAGTDGWIGFYAKTSATGWQTSLNLDGAAGATADMDGSTSLSLISDGQWHLYEWSLDSNGWGAVPGIGGGHAGGTLVNSAHTIDSIYFRDLDGTAGPTADIFLDFVAYNGSGSVALLVPEPSTVAIGALGGLALLIGVRRKDKK